MPEIFIPSLPQTRVFKLGRIRRERMLPARGTVMVQNGSRVGSLDIVAKSNTAGHLRPVPLARYLRTTEANLSKYLLKQPGDEVQEREMIASKPELFGTLRRTYRAPSAGHIAALQGAWLTLDLADKPFELQALYRGTVVNVVQRYGVLIEATGALAQGVWGAGGECYGVLKKMVDSPEMILQEDKVDLSSRGVILIAGAGATENTIRRAAQERAAGLIVGGLQPHLRELVKTLSLPTLVTEGLGELSMSAPFFDLLTMYEGNEAIVNTFAGARNSMRPEVFVPMVATGAGETGLVPPTLVTEVGATVRVTGGPHIGEIGTIADMSSAPHSFESGVSAWGADIELTSGNRVFVPWENLELIG